MALVTGFSCRVLRSGCGSTSWLGFSRIGGQHCRFSAATSLQRAPVRSEGRPRAGRWQPRGPRAMSLQPASAWAEGSPEDQKLVSFGKHAGLTYAEIAEKHPGYGAWLVKSVARNDGQKKSEAMRELACYFDASLALQKAQPNAQPAPIEESQLTQEQREAAERVLMLGENVFITGAAGTGKSFLLRYLIQELERRHRGEVAVTASTGIAAANIGGQTLHSFAGIGLGWGGVRGITKKIQKNQFAVRRWKQARVLIVDEVSMLDGSLFTKLEKIAQNIREDSAPFGGLQLLLCGDFLQLPPVQDADGFAETQFCFQTDAWRSCGLEKGVVLFQECVRQAADPTFAELLNEIRVGKVSRRTQDLFKACGKNVKPPPPDDGITPTKLYCYNREVDKENELQLDKLPGDVVTYKADDTWTSEDSANNSQKKSFVDTMNKRVPKKLHLKVDAQVILTRNKQKQGLVNGSRGIVVDLRDSAAKVRFDNGLHAWVQPETFELNGSNGTRLERLQVPLKLGWALTVHKAAGLTLSRAELQIDGAFAAGQAYVALSRVTGTEGLWTSGRGIKWSNTRADPEALKFYEDHQKMTLGDSEVDESQDISNAAEEKVQLGSESPTTLKTQCEETIKLDVAEDAEIPTMEKTRRRKKKVELSPPEESLHQEHLQPENAACDEAPSQKKTRRRKKTTANVQ